MVYIRFYEVDKRLIIKFVNLIKLLINLVSMHDFSRISGILGGVSYKNPLMAFDGRQGFF
jgi:hypothetical protein